MILIIDMAKAFESTCVTPRLRAAISAVETAAAAVAAAAPPPQRKRRRLLLAG